MIKAHLFASGRSWYCLAIFCVVAAALTGCGAATMSSDGTQSGGGTIVAGVGVGGTGVVRSASAPASNIGLIGAVVFLDKNNNSLPDPDEPFTYTDQVGNYMLLADAADLAAYPLLLQAVASATIDKATGKPVTEGFVVPLVQ